MATDPKIQISKAERLFGRKDDSDQLRKSREREQEIIRRRRMEQEKAPQK
jgi:hypothetical protein